MKSSDANLNFPNGGSKQRTFAEIDPSRPVKFYDINDVIREMDLHQTIALLGEAGSGKTYTSCHYLAKKYSEGHRVLFATQSHKCLRNIISEFYKALDTYEIEKKPEKKKIGVTFAKLGGIGGVSCIDQLPKNTIIYADECGFLNKESLSSLITLIKRGYHVIFSGDIKQDCNESYYATLIASSINYLSLIGETNDKYYEEALMYNAFGNYYNEFWWSLLKDLTVDNLPYAIRLEAGPHPLHTRFDSGYDEVCLDEVPYHLGKINLFISRELCAKHSRKLQEKRKKRLEKVLDISNVPCLWANAENKEDHDETTFGPIYPMQLFRICEDSNDKKKSYYSGDILKFLEYDERGNAKCWNTISGKNVLLPRSAFVNIKSAECYTLAEYQGNRTKKDVIVIARKGSLNATRLFTLNTRAEGKISYVILSKADNDAPIGIEKSAKYLSSLHDKPRLKDIFGDYETKVIKDHYQKALASREKDVMEKLEEKDDEFLDLVCGISALRFLKGRWKKTNKDKELSYFESADRQQLQKFFNSDRRRLNSAVLGLKKIFGCNKIGSNSLKCMPHTDKENDVERRAPSVSAFLSSVRDFTVDRLNNVCSIIIHKKTGVRELIDYVEDHPSWHRRLKNWRSIVANVIVDELDKRKKDKENSASKVFGEFLSLKYINTSNGRWSKLPYLASVCVSRKDLLSALFDVDDIADYVENEILSKFDDPSFTTAFRTCVNYFREIPESRPETIRRKLIKNSNNRNEITLEKTPENYTEDACILAKTHLRLADSDKKFFYSSGACLDTGQTFPINYGVSKKDCASSEFRQAKTVQEVLQQNKFYSELSEDCKYSHALNIKDSHLLVIDNDGDENVTKMIEERAKELGVDVLRETSPSNPHKAHYFFSCNLSSNNRISCAFVHREESKFKADVFLPTANHLIYRKDKVSMGKDLPDAHDFSDIIKVIILSRK